MITSKKSVSEIPSFLLIVLLITIFAVGMYSFLGDELEEKKTQYELKRAEKILVELESLVNQISFTNGSSISYSIFFEKGEYNFYDDRIEYVSEVFNSNLGEEVCLSYLCYDNSQNVIILFKEISTNGFDFDEKSTLKPGKYEIVFENQNSFIILRGP